MVKEALLRALRGRQEPLSGEELSRCLGVSRAAVWKAVNALRAEGCYFVTVEELFALRGVTPENGKVYRRLPPT